MKLLQPLDRCDVAAGYGCSGSHEKREGEQSQDQDEPLGIHRKSHNVEVEGVSLFICRPIGSLCGRGFFRWDGFGSFIGALILGFVIQFQKLVLANETETAVTHYSPTVMSNGCRCCRGSGFGLGNPPCV